MKYISTTVIYARGNAQPPTNLYHVSYFETWPVECSQEKFRCTDSHVNIPFLIFLIFLLQWTFDYCAKFQVTLFSRAVRIYVSIERTAAMKKRWKTCKQVCDESRDTYLKSFVRKCFSHRLCECLRILYF